MALILKLPLKLLKVGATAMRDKLVSKHWSNGPLAVMLLVFGDLLALFDACALSYFCRFEWHFFLPPHPNPAPVTEYLKLWAVGSFMSLLLFNAYGLYQTDKVKNPLDCITPIFKAGAWAVALILAVSYFYREASFSRLAVFYNCIFAFAFLSAFRCGFCAYRAHLKAKGIGKKNIVLVGSRELPRHLAERIVNDPSYGYDIVAVVDDVLISDSFLEHVERGYFEDLPKLVSKYRVDEVLIGHPAVGHHQLLELIASCERMGIPIRMVPATYDLLIDRSDFAEVGGIPLLSVNEQKSNSSYHHFKRLFDFVLSACLIVLFSPVFILSAILVKLGSEGSFLFCQERVGKNGKSFRMYKFRTMVDGAADLLPSLVDVQSLNEPVFKIENDPRVTPIGQFLRKSSIDELPQLFNVLKGDMSLVGPRPEEVQVVEKYDVSQRRRLKLSPGITGLQQIHCRGTRSMEERVRWDILYLRRESFVLDLWILFKTIGAVVMRRGNL